MALVLFREQVVLEAGNSKAAQVEESGSVVQGVAESLTHLSSQVLPPPSFPNPEGVWALTTGSRI